MRVARTLVIASTTLAACGLNLDGFTGGAPTADAGTPAPPPPEPPQAPMDASTPDDGAEAASPPSCPTDAMFCEGFEAFTGWDGMDEESGATCAVTTSRAHTGTHALRAFGPAVPSGGMQNQCYYQHALPQPPPARLAMRAFVYVVSPIGNGSGWDPIQAHAKTAMACQSGSMYQGYDSNGAFGTFQTATSTSSVRAASASQLPTDRWTCIEYVFDESANGHFTMYVDDVAVIDAAATYADGDPFCGFADIDVGLAGHFTDHDLEIDWDDVVVAPHRIGCQ